LSGCETHHSASSLLPHRWVSHPLNPPYKSPPETIMAAKMQALDVWLVEGDTVYKESAVHRRRGLDSGRPAARKRSRASAGHREVDSPWRLEACCLPPQGRAAATQDQAEALEAVTLDFTFKRPHGDEDDDPT